MTFGYRRLWALLRFREGQRITSKTVYRICTLKGWLVLGWLDSGGALHTTRRDSGAPR
jgi:hypothetical protein